MSERVLVDVPLHDVVLVRLLRQNGRLCRRALELKGEQNRNIKFPEFCTFFCPLCQLTGHLESVSTDSLWGGGGCLSLAKAHLR